MARLIVVMVAVGLALIGHGSARAEGLLDQLQNLYGKGGIVVAGPNAQAFQGSSLLELGTLASAFPISGFDRLAVQGASTGFTYEFDASIGAFVRSTESFGPFFGFRPETIGKNKVSISAFWTRGDFTSLDGVPLDDLSLRQTFVDPSTGNTISSRISIDTVLNVVAFGASYGITDDIEVGLLLPVIIWSRHITGVAQSNQPGVVFPGGSTELIARDSSTTTGVGDIVLRSRWNFARGPLGAVALGLDLTLPSGDFDDNTGFGTVRGFPYFVASSTPVFGASAHAAFGFHIGADTDNVQNSFFFNAGVDWAATPWLTLSADVVGEHVIGNKRPTPNQSPGARLNNTLVISDNNTYNLGVGFAVNPWRTLLVRAGVVLPLNDTGQKAIFPAVGLQYTF